MVVAKKILTAEQLADFEKHYHLAKMTVVDRSEHMAAVLRRLETDLQLICLTGVEDRLQVLCCRPHVYWMVSAVGIKHRKKV